MREFTWQANYKIGNATIDHQHEHLFELANRLVAARDNNQLIEGVMALYQHVREHFAAEENLMKQYHYPAYAEHVAAHNLMLDRLVAISDRIHAGAWQPDDVLKFMREWILVHILEVDMQLAHFLAKQQTTTTKPQ